MNREQIRSSLDELRAGGGDFDTQLSTAVEMLHNSNPRFHWSGIYELYPDNVLRLGPFIGAPTDQVLRAFDAKTGEEIWTQRLPYTANATPLTYRLRPDGKQFVVIAAGGHGWSTPGDAVMAFTLP